MLSRPGKTLGVRKLADEHSARLSLSLNALQSSFGTMPSIKGFTITYDALNEARTFSEGDVITGNVTLALFKQTKVERLFVKAKGDTEVRWTRGSGDKSRTYSAHQRLFKLKQFLIPDDYNEIALPKGIHVYKFNMKIPTGSMPTSFRGSHGKIVYKLEAKLSRSWKIDSTAEQEINFVSKSILNFHLLMSQQVASTTKEMGLFSTGHVHMDVITTKTAYAQGETMAIVAKINNSSSSEMTPKFSIKQDIVYRASGGTKEESKVIFKMVENSIQPQRQEMVQCAMKIPIDLTPTIQNCEIISVEYRLKVYLDISFAFDPEVVLPVVILPANLAPSYQNSGAVGPHQVGPIGGPSNSDFPPPAVSAGPYPASPHSGSYRYRGVQSYSTPPPAYPYQPPHMTSGYNNPVPQLPSRYGSPYSSSASSPVLHPPPSGLAFYPPPPALTPSAPQVPSFQSSTAPNYNLMPSAPAMNTDFLSQTDEAPPAYSLLFPSSPPEKI
ncbi:arrestin domain-containing protein 3-like [Leuresthes tenuis]|uniref:arrestin domain-containing protein 3-like n=1 Tax=Leuresthes tenuis TaxID=355514 RepID=UPI003B506C9E